MGIGGIRFLGEGDELILNEVWSNTPGDEWVTQTIPRDCEIIGLHYSVKPTGQFYD